ncbi:MAG: hypothetical protein ACM3NV_01395 [Syntrophothermus sp.]
MAVTVRADADAVWSALIEADLIELARRKPLIGVLGGARALPEIASRLLHGERPPGAPERMRLRDMPTLPMEAGGWILLGERPGEEIALGLVGRFWRPVIEYANVDAASFGAFAEPDWAKTIYALAVNPRECGVTLLTGTMRTATTDAGSRRKFDRYWTFGVGSGAHVLVRGLLEAVREDAESRPG